MRSQYRERTGVPARAARVGWWMRPGRARNRVDRQVRVTRSLRLPVLTSLSLIQRIPTLAVKVAQVLNLNEIKACAFYAGE